MGARKLLAAVIIVVAPTITLGQSGYQRSRRNAAGKAMPSGAYKELAGTFHGALKEINGKEIVIESDEHQIVSIRRSRKTKFFKDDREIKATEIPLNAPVSIDAAEDLDLKPTAISVRVDSQEKKNSNR